MLGIGLLGSCILLWSAFGEVQQNASLTAEEWESVSAANHFVGATDPSVTVIVFSDYQCPACARAETYLMRAVAELSPHVRLGIRHFPLETIHPHARSAALAAECAGRDGQFFPYHQALFRNQASIGDQQWARVLPDLDPVRMAHCMAGTDAAEAVRRDIAAGRAVGVNSTPTIFVEGKRLGSLKTYSGLVSELRRTVEAHGLPRRGHPK